MSTLRVNAIQNATGGDLITAKGMARAWVNFDGTGTVAIRTSYNVSSITDVSTGRYTVNFATAMTDADYCTVATAGSTSAGASYFSSRISGSPSASAVTVSNHIQSSGQPVYFDADVFNVIVME